MLSNTFKNCPGFLRGYLRYLEMVENLAPRTLRARHTDIKDFLQFLMRHNGTPEPADGTELWVEDMTPELVLAATENDLYGFQTYLVEQRNLSDVTLYRRILPSLRGFYDYLIRFQEELGIQIARNPVPVLPKPSPPENPCRILSRAEISKLLENICGETAVRDAAIVLLMITTGLSVSDVAKIRYTDYHESELYVSDRKVYLTEACQEAINRYIRVFRQPLEDFLKDNTLFVTRTLRKRLSARGIQNALQKHFDRAGIEASARDLRHTAVVELLKNARNECERSYLAGRLGYTSPASINSLPLPKPNGSDPLPSLVENSWLNDIGKPRGSE